MPKVSCCPERRLLQRFLQGRIAPHEADQIEAHLSACTACAHLLDTLYSRDPELEGATPYAPAQIPEKEQAVIAGIIDNMRHLKPAPAHNDTSTLTIPLSHVSTAPQPYFEFDTASTFLPIRKEQGSLGPYRLLKILGRGGMGIVYQAEDPTLHRLVALKVMKPVLARNNFYRQRFLREARALAALEHDHIVPIYQVGEDRDVLFLALPLLKGETLQDRLRKGKFLGWPEILRIGCEIARGLAAAHELNLLHRDIKPSNLWLEAGSERVKILDFGLAAPFGVEGMWLEENTIVGTPAYMSPEQARAQPLDARSDLFSLGCVLYRLCTEKPAFAKEDKISLLISITTDHPRPVRELRADCPSPLADLVMQLLEKDPKDRPESAAAVAETMAAIRRRLLLAPLKRRLQVTAFVLWAGLFVWAGTAWGPWLYLCATNQAVLKLESEDKTATVLVKQDDRVVAELHADAPQPAQLPAGKFQLVLPGNPDGLQLAIPELVLGRGMEEKVMVRRVPLQRGELVLDADNDVMKVSLHRAGKQIALVHLPALDRLDLPAGDYEVHLVDEPKTLRTYPARVTVEAGEKTRIQVCRVGEWLRITNPGAAVNSLAVDAQGKRLLAGMADRAIGLWSLPSGQETFYLKKHANPVTCVALSGDGRRALSGGGEKGPRPDCALRLWDIAQGNVVATLEGTKQVITCVAFSKNPDVAFAGAGNTITQWDLAENKILRSWIAHETKLNCLTVLPDGNQIITGGSDGPLHLWDVAQAQIVRSFTGHGDAVRDLAISADGTKLASASWDGTVRCWDIATAKEIACLRGHEGWVLTVALTPDGRRVLSGGADKSVRLWDLEQRTELLRFDGHTAAVNSVAFLPDGRQAVSGGKDQQILLWKLP